MDLHPYVSEITGGIAQVDGVVKLPLSSLDKHRAAIRALYKEDRHFVMSMVVMAERVREKNLPQLADQLMALLEDNFAALEHERATTAAEAGAAKAARDREDAKTAGPVLQPNDRKVGLKGSLLDLMRASATDDERSRLVEDHAATCSPEEKRELVKLLATKDASEPHAMVLLFLLQFAAGKSFVELARLAVETGFDGDRLVRLGEGARVGGRKLDEAIRAAIDSH